MKFRNVGIVFAIVVVAAAAAVILVRRDAPGTRPLPAADAVTPTVVVLGAVLPLTGEVAAYGSGSREGLEFAIDQANKKQSKYRFEVTVEDSKGDAKTALNALQSLLARKKPIAIIGESISSPTLAMVPVIDAAKIVLVSPSASAPSLTGSSRYFFRVFPSDTAEGAFMCEVIKQRVSDAKVCIVYVNNDYGVGLKDVFLANAKRSNIAVLDTFGYEKGAADFRPILAKVKSLEPNAIYLPSYYQDGAALLKQARELGITASFWGATPHDDPQFLAIAGQAAEGFRYPVAATYDEASSEDQVKSFVEGFQSKVGKTPGLLAALGYDSAKLLIDAVVANGPTSDGIREFIASQKSYSGVSGTMTFDEHGDVHKPIRLKLVKDGKTVGFESP